MNKKKGSGSGYPYKNNASNPLYDTSLSEGIVAFKDRLSAEGFGMPDIQADGDLHRFHVEGEKKGSRNGWYVFYSSPVYSAGYGNWKTGQSSTWTLKSDKKLSHTERQSLKKMMWETKEKRRKAKQQSYREAEKRALSIWNKSRPASKNHRYAIAKRMGVAGLRQLRGSLVVPLFQGGKITSLQFIDESGKKRFLSGGRIKGSCFIWGNVRHSFDIAYIAESPSTGYSVHVLADYVPVFCAMSYNNLDSIAVAVREKWSHVKIIIAADNDINENGFNVGVEYAKKAASACAGFVSIPESPNGSKVDWCDLRLMALGVGCE